MKEILVKIRRIITAGIICSFCIAFGSMTGMVQAEELIGIFEEAAAEYAMTEADPMTGIWEVPEGWTEDDRDTSEDVFVYKLTEMVGMTDTSSITCSYMDTNYSVLEYEQLRDMLTNNLLYANVDAQISTSAVYTKAKDCLYIVIVDDSAQSYRDIYHYVVGDYRCFSVEVREYRSEAEQMKASDLKTPQEVGQQIAEEFTWDTAW